MVEALRDYQPGKYGNGADCFAEIENLGRYKNVSATRALNPHFKEYDIDIWKDIIDVFAMKVYNGIRAVFRRGNTGSDICHGSTGG